MSGNIADRLGLSNEVREFKLGKSFAERTGNAFHSVRYDFKPASVDTSKMATVDIGESNQVTVTVPHVEGTAQTVFRGSRRPYQKECVLIIDHNTGEITLEKLSTNIQLKKTRAEGSSRALQGRPITPIENPTVGNSNYTQQASNSKRPSPNNSHSQPMRYSPKHSGHSPGNANQRSWISPQTSPSIEIHNNSASPSMPNILANTQISSSRSSSGHNNPRNGNNNQTVQSHVPPSMPQLNSLLEEQPHEVSEVGVLSDSSGSDLSSSSGEEDNNDDKPREPHDELEAMLLSEDPEPMDTNAPVKNKGGHSTSGSSCSSSSDSEDSDVPTPNKKASKGTKKSATSPPVKTSKVANAALSMPKFSQLSEDLQLSESGSDSDD